ncbi:MAG: aryl-sulfate sulfotransferase [Candidatus Thorarchaeota archaeon]
MKSFKSIGFVIVAFCIASLASPIGSDNSSLLVNLAQNSFNLNVDAPNNSTHVQVLEDAINRTYNTADAFQGLNLIELQVFPTYESTNTREDYAVIVDMEGNVINGFYQNDRSGHLQFVNSTTVFFSDAVSGNFTLWNIYTNETEYTMAPSGHHDSEYNPVTETFMTIVSVNDQGDYNWSGDVQPIVGDDIVEYDKDGNEIWRWNGSLTFPFNENEWMLRNESRRGEIDWMHSNGLYWDIEDNAIYLSVRHLDCVVKVDYETGDTVWVAGRYTGEGPALTMHNLMSEEVDTIYYHTHAVELIAPNTLLLFDNDFWNLTRPDPLFGISGYVEFTVDENAMTATETWTWRAPEEYYADSQGDATRLPNGNTLGAFNLRPRPIVTEVNQAGDIVWEWFFEPTDFGSHTYGWGVSANGIMRFLEGPEIAIDVDSAWQAPSTLTMSVWEVTQFRWTTNGSVRVFEDGELLTEEEFTFLPHWQETPLSISLPGLAAGSHELTIEIENEDGMTSSIDLGITIPSDILLYGAIIGGVAVVLVVVLYFWIKKR